MARLRATRTRCTVYNPKTYASFAPVDELFPAVAHAFASEYQRAAVIESEGIEWYGLVRRPRP